MPGLSMMMPCAGGLFLSLDSAAFWLTMGTGLTWGLVTIFERVRGTPVLKSSVPKDTNLHLAPSRVVEFPVVFKSLCFSLSLYLQQCRFGDRTPTQESVLTLPRMVSLGRVTAACTHSCQVVLVGHHPLMDAVAVAITRVGGARSLVRVISSYTHMAVP